MLPDFDPDDTGTSPTDQAPVYGDRDPFLCDGCGAGAYATTDVIPTGWAVFEAPDLHGPAPLLCRPCLHEALCSHRRARGAA